MKNSKLTVHILCIVFEVVFAALLVLCIVMTALYANTYNNYYGWVGKIENVTILHIYVTHFIGIFLSCAILALVVTVHILLIRKQRSR